MTMDIIASIAEFAALVTGYLQYIFNDVVDRLTGQPTTEPLTGMDFMAQQIREILIMASCGACVAFMFQAYNGCIKRWLTVSSTHHERHMKLRRAAPLLVRGALVVPDIIFCMITGMVIANFWFSSSYGRLSIHETLGMIAGMTVGIRTFAFGKSKRRHTIAVIYVILITTAYFLIS